MKKTLALTLLVMLMAGCAGQPQTREAAVSEEPTPTESATAAAAPTRGTSPTATPAPAGERTLEVWFTYGDALFLTRRVVSGTPAVGRAAIEQLLARPNDFESNAGVSTAIPPGIRLLDLAISNGIASVDLSEGFGHGSGSTGELLSVAQVVYTLTQFPTVEGVLFKVEGESLRETPGHGLLLSGPQTRRDWKDQLAPIVVTQPAMGDRVSSPLTVEGTADVFEATVQMRLLDSQGGRLARAFTTATCGTGCRGNFTHELEFAADTEQHGVLEVWWESPQDGARKDVMRIALTLAP